MVDIIRPLKIWGPAGAVAAACTAVQMARLPIVLSGANLGVLHGYRRDPHLLTGAVWHVFAAACDFSAPWVIGVDAALFALLISVVAILLAKRIGLAAALLLAAALGLSPFDVPLVVGPLGGETSVTFALFVLAAAGIAGVWNFSWGVRTLIGAGIVMQDPGLTGAALVYSPLGTLAAVAVRIAAGNPPLSSIGGMRFDDLAAPITLAVLGTVIVFAVPLSLYGAKVDAYRRFLGIPVRVAARVALFAALAGCGGLIASTGDPSQHFLCAEAALVFLAVAWAAYAVPPLRLQGLSVLTAASFAALLVIHHSIPSVRIAKETAYLQRSMAQDMRDGFSTCLVADSSARAHLLVVGLTFDRADLARTIDRCSGHRADTTHLFSATGLNVSDWGVSGLNLAYAAQAQGRGRYVFPVSGGEVAPRVHMKTPTGVGVFAQHLATASGAVSSFTVLGGFSYRFPCVDVVPGEHLSFAVAQIPGAPPAPYAVTISTRRISRAVVQGVLERNLRTDYAWRFVSVPLAVHIPCADVTFRVPFPETRQGTWVTFAGASLSPRG